MRAERLPVWKSLGTERVLRQLHHIGPEYLAGRHPLLVPFVTVFPQVYVNLLRLGRRELDGAGAVTSREACIPLALIDLDIHFYAGYRHSGDSVGDLDTEMPRRRRRRRTKREPYSHAGHASHGHAQRTLQLVPLRERPAERGFELRGRLSCVRGGNRLNLKHVG